MAISKVKVCGLKRLEDVQLALDLGVNYLGFIMVKKSKRYINKQDVIELFNHIDFAKYSAKKVLVVQNMEINELKSILNEIDFDIVQLHGEEDNEYIDNLKNVEVWKAVNLESNSDIEQILNCHASIIVADSKNAGSGETCNWELVKNLAKKREVFVAGGINCANVKEAIEKTQAYGVDLASGIEIDYGIKSKDKLIKLMEIIKKMKKTKFGIYGGQYIAETLMRPILELEVAYDKYKDDPDFLAEYQDLLKHYVGRQSALYYAKRLSDYAGGAKIYLKREDLNHTGAHKINNALGQGLLAKRMGKTRLIAETGAGMHGVATATVAALLGMECEIFMGATDVVRQAPNVDRMHTLGTKVTSVHEGSATLKDAMNVALRSWASCVDDTFYVIGTAAGPHPYPMLVKDFQSVIGKEARAQILEREGKLPNEVIACIGGGSNAIGIFAGFENDSEVKLTGVEAGGLGVETGYHAASINGGRPGILHGMKSYLLQDKFGQIQETYSVSAGLDYPGVGPEHCYWADIKKATYVPINDSEAIDAFDTLSRMEGIIPALESSHAIAQAIKAAKNYTKDDIILVNLSGRGDKDMDNIKNYKERMKNEGK